MATRIIALISIVFALSGCGGGGDDGQPPERISSSTTLQTAKYSSVSFTPRQTGYYTVTADADISLSNTSNDDLLIDVEVGAREIGLPLGYIIARRTHSTVASGEHWTGHTSASSKHYLFAGTAYTFIVYAINSRSATAAVELTNARIFVEPPRQVNSN